MFLADTRLATPVYELLVAALIALGSLYSSDAAAATKYASPQGSANASGDQQSAAWDALSCFSRLSPGDTCIYLAGDYGRTNFAPEDSGTANNRIVHRCETRHGCIFDRLEINGVSHVNVVNIASDSTFYNSGKSHTNPRMTIYNSHHLKFDSIRVRGEPNQCAAGNPSTGCSGSSPYNRYIDLVQVGRPDSEDATSSAIEITGASEFMDGNHSVMQFHDDGNNQRCESDESDIWIHGTAQTPIKLHTRYHHLVAMKGACRILIEYADFGPVGTGRADLAQPTNGTSDQAGGTIHGSTMQNVIVRFSNFTSGGSATSVDKNKAHIEVGLFGDGVNGACFPHNSHYRSWGSVAIFGRVNNVPDVRNVSLLNNAVEGGWYMARQSPGAATSEYNGFVFVRTGAADNVAAEVDGIVADDESASGGLLYGRSNSTYDFSRAPISADGLTIGSNVRQHGGRLFQNPANWNFQPRESSPLIGNASPIAETRSAGSGTIVPITRPECFAGTMAGMRQGDRIEIGGQACTVVATNLSDRTLTCDQSINWSSGDSIFYVVDGQQMRDIGSRSSGTPIARPLPPEFQ